MADRQYDVRAALLDSLISKVDAEPFPSLTMLDQIEELLTPDDVPRYAQMLLKKVEDEQFPSVSMLQRIASLT
ncbi:MAG: hypothetical protein ACXVWU_07810 [Nocardioides sp.]